VTSLDTRYEIRVKKGAETARRQAGYVQHYLDHLTLRSLDDWAALAAFRPEINKSGEWLETRWHADPELAAELAIAIGDNSTSVYDTRTDEWLRLGISAAETTGGDSQRRRLYRVLSERLETKGQYEEAEKLRRESLKIAEELKDNRGVAVTQSSLGDLLVTRGQYAEAERLYRASLAVFEGLGDSRGVAVTQYQYGNMLRGLGRIEEAKTLHTVGLENAVSANDPMTAAGHQMGLGQIALAEGDREAARAWLLRAREGFATIGLMNWVENVDELLAQTEGERLTLDDLAGMARAARAGDRDAGQQAWDIAGELMNSGDEALAALGDGLRRVLAGQPAAQALAGVPEEWREALLQLLEG
jgi:tetratricopeptide (TPR) repeat protein